MQPHLGPLPVHAPGDVVRIVAFVRAVESRSGSTVVAIGLVGGAEVLIHAERVEIQPQHWIMADVTSTSQEPDANDRMSVTLRSLVCSCPSSATERAARRGLRP